MMPTPTGSVCIELHLPTPAYPYHQFRIDGTDIIPVHELIDLRKLSAWRNPPTDAGYYGWGWQGAAPRRVARLIANYLFPTESGLADSMSLPLLEQVVSQWPAGRNVRCELEVTDFIIDNRHRLIAARAYSQESIMLSFLASVGGRAAKPAPGLASVMPRLIFRTRDEDLNQNQSAAPGSEPGNQDTG